METFCHQLKPSGYLHVQIEDNYLDLIVLRDRAYQAGVSLDASPEAKQLLQPCDVVEVIFQKNKITVLVNDEPIIRNKVTTDCEAREALTLITQSFCKLSKAHAESLGKRRDAKAVKDEALELLNKIEQQHQEDFTKFILILNEKKKKIRELQRKLGIRNDDPEDIEDDIGVLISTGNDSSQAKKARISEQLALEGPSTSGAQRKSQEEGDIGEDDEGDRAEDVDDEADKAEDIDEEFLSDEEHSDRAPSEPEEINEDYAPAIETSPMKKKEGTTEGEQVPRIKEEIKIKEEKMSVDDGEGSECGSPRRGPIERRPQPKKTSLDMLNDLL